MNIPGIPDLKTAAIVAAVTGVIAFAAGWTVCDWRMTAKANGEALQRAQTALDDLAAMTKDRDRLAGLLATSDDTHLNDLKVAQDETNRLRDRLRDGSIGLRIAGTCPKAGGTPAPAGAGVDTGTGAELAEPARRAYFALRDGIDRADAKLAACQDQLRLRTVKTD